MFESFSLYLNQEIRGLTGPNNPEIRNNKIKRLLDQNGAELCPRAFKLIILIKLP